MNTSTTRRRVPRVPVVRRGGALLAGSRQFDAYGNPSQYETAMGSDVEGRNLTRYVGTGWGTTLQWRAEYLNQWSTMLTAMTMGPSSAVYDYYFDIENQRFAKVYPTGIRDD